MAQMQMTGVPKGYHSLTPFLVVTDIARSIDFYRRAFGAEERMRMAGPDDKRVMHAELGIGDSVLMLGDESPERGCFVPASLKAHTGGLYLYVSDVDAAFARATGGGGQGDHASDRHVLVGPGRGGRGPVRAPVEPRRAQGRPDARGDEGARASLVCLKGEVIGTPGEDVAKRSSPILRKKGKRRFVDSGRPESLEDEIRLRAYYRYLERGAESGDEVSDWLEAESDVLARRATGVDADEKVSADGH